MSKNLKPPIMSKALETYKALESIDRLRVFIERLELQTGEYMIVRSELSELESKIIEIYDHKDNNS